MELVFCTYNQHKISEVAAMSDARFQWLTLGDIQYSKEIPEPYVTLEENSQAKAMQVYRETGRDCFAEDSGLFIEALNGEPGVFSARYAGIDANSREHIQKVLSNMDSAENRSAYFKTVITLILQGSVHQFTGICHGDITRIPEGEGGFGYDPIFKPQGATQTFAMMSPEMKNAISHRRKAFDAFMQFLNRLQPNG